MRPTARVSMLSCVLAATLLVGCSDPELPDALPRGTDEPAGTGDDAAPEEIEVDEEPSGGPPTVAELERTAELELPDGASEVTIERLESGEGLRAVFSLPSAELAAWCQEQALGASTPSSAGLDDELRDRFAIAADVPDDDLRRCLGSAPSDPEVQREVLATGTAGETASVHLVVEVWPTR